MQQQNIEHKEKKRKESILDLSKYLEKNIRVKFAGGREAAGILKGYDPLLNLVLDNTTEYLRGNCNDIIFKLLLHACGRFAYSFLLISSKT